MGDLIKEIYLKDNIKWPPVMFIPMIANMSPVTEFINNLIGIIENINLLFNELNCISHSERRRRNYMGTPN